MKYLKVKKGKCIYCREMKIHPAFIADELCSSCASDVIEDFNVRIAKWNQNKRKTIKDDTNRKKTENI